MAQILPTRVDNFRSYPLLAASAVSKMYQMAKPNEEEMSAIRLLCNDIKHVREECEKQNFLIIHSRSTLFARTDLASSYQLALECWNVLSDEDCPHRSPEAHAKITAWYRVCEERFQGWYTSDGHHFENSVRVQDILHILHRWHLIEMLNTTDEGRGLDCWLKWKGFIADETQTRFDQTLKKTVVIDEKTEAK